MKRPPVQPAGFGQDHRGRAERASGGAEVPWRRETVRCPESCVRDRLPVRDDTCRREGPTTGSLVNRDSLTTTDEMANSAIAFHESLEYNFVVTVRAWPETEGFVFGAMLHKSVQLRRGERVHFGSRVKRRRFMAVPPARAHCCETVVALRSVDDVQPIVAPFALCARGAFPFVFCLPRNGVSTNRGPTTWQCGWCDDLALAA